MHRLIRNLVFIYHIIRASEHLLVVAAEATKDDWLGDYFRKHLEEERHHHKWLAEDLSSVGIDVNRTTIPIISMQMVGSVYYMIFHVDAAALLGYMKVLEEGASNLDRLEIPPETPHTLLRTVRHHAKHDPHHAREINAMIERLVPERRALVEQMSTVTKNFLEREIATWPFPPPRSSAMRELH